MAPIINMISTPTSESRVNRVPTFRPVPLDEEIHFSVSDIIVSKTDLKGRIVYANDVFCDVAEMSTDQVIGQPHNIIRHPDMPRVIFKLLWDTLQKGNEIFAYVKNMSSTGKYYWVLAHVTPTLDKNKKIIGYHSNRRAPNKTSVSEVSALYKELQAIESQHTSPKQGLDASLKFLEQKLSSAGQSYEEFVWGIGQ